MYNKGVSLGKTINHQAVLLSESGDAGRVEASGQIELHEPGSVKETEDEAQMPGISCIINLLYFSYGLFCHFRGLTMDRRTPTTAFPNGIELTTTERTNIVDHTGVVLLQEGARGDLCLFFCQPVLRNIFLHTAPDGLRKALHSLLDKNTFQGDGIYITHLCAAIGTPDLADGVLLEVTDIALKAFVYLF